MIAANPATTAAAAAAMARRHVVARFTEAQAFSPATAIIASGRSRMERRYFADLEAHGAVIATATGHYYLDRAKLKAHDARRRKRALTIIGTVLAATAAAASFLR